jgi:pimeloyl-ACP methyl ester carboxylesterase
LLRHVTSPDGVRIACQVEGAGTALVMVHGAGSARWTFDLVRPHLQDRFEVWTLDRRGRGDSDDADSYAIEREFDDVATVVREAGEGALLFGHSYGGLVAAGAAARLDGLPRLALYEAPMGGVLADEAWTARFEAHLEADEREAAMRDFMSDVGGYTDAEIEAMKGTPAWQARLAASPTQWTRCGWASAARRCCWSARRVRTGRSDRRRPSPRRSPTAKYAPSKATATAPP